jgi:uncharacterized membrane protein
MSTEHDALPRMADGFRHRGASVTRLEAFVDAAFAFALTLLVISIDAIPDSIDSLLLALRAVPSFAMGFVLIAMFWYLHARWSRRYGLDDLPSTLLSLLLVFLALVYVYPLKLLAGLLFAWMTNGWLPAPVMVSGVDDLRVVFVVYGIAFATLCLCIAELYAHALRRREVLRLDIDECAATTADVATWRFAVLVGALSAVIALLLPADAAPWQIASAGFVYFLMNLTWLVARIAQRRARARLLAAQP